MTRDEAHERMLQIRALVAKHGSVADNKALTSIFAAYDQAEVALDAALAEQGRLFAERDHQFKRAAAAERELRERTGVVKE